jgi:uncharacterized coiled-coil DUF342 family protein
MNINRVELCIVPFNIADCNTYGFDYEFDDGLNIITGDNSSGKSTILSCIYYCLGLEQLIGSKGSKTLSPALKDYFKYNKKDVKVKTSYCKLYITSENGNSYILKRWIKTEDPSDKTFNEIEIYTGAEHFSKYVHSPRDHEEHGFYRWLADINKLDVINVEKGVRGGEKPLYMQNIFALSFVEQTKGWADFFSMMPPFGIKDIKKKVVEYALGLSSLENSIKLDEIKLEKERLKEIWAREVSYISFQANYIQASISTVRKDTPVSKKDIDRVYAALLWAGGEILPLRKVISKVEVEISEYSNKIDSVKGDFITASDLISERDKTLKSILGYKEDLKETEINLYSEIEKVKTYNSTIQQISFDLNDFTDIKKITVNRDWRKVATENCPLCEQALASISDCHISTPSIDQSTTFLKSQLVTYKSYLTASLTVIERYKSAIDFYNRKIEVKRVELNSLYQDLDGPSISSLRGFMQKIAELNLRLNELNSFDVQFNGTKEKLVLVSHDYFEQVKLENDLNDEIDVDQVKVSNFETKFIGYLNIFGYKSNGTKNIKITKNANSNYMPIVQYGSEAQSIRYVSSASDFVRSLWSYYFSLLVNSERHPGFLVLDEPGQHQMRLSSLQELLKCSVASGKQVILAISQDRKYNTEDEKVNVIQLLNQLKGVQLKHHHIADGNGCVIPYQRALPAEK